MITLSESSDDTDNKTFFLIQGYNIYVRLKSPIFKLKDDGLRESKMG